MEEVKARVCETKVFEVKQTTLFYSCELGNCHRDPQLKRLRRTNIVEQAFQFWSKGLPFKSMLASVRYDDPDNTNATHLPWTYQILNSPICHKMF